MRKGFSDSSLGSNGGEKKQHTNKCFANNLASKPYTLTVRNTL